MLARNLSVQQSHTGNLQPQSSRDTVVSLLRGYSQLSYVASAPSEHAAVHQDTDNIYFLHLPDIPQEIAHNAGWGCEVISSLNHLLSPID